MLMKLITKGMVVCCPKCGTAASISEIGIDRFVCKNCKTRFGGWVVNGFVVTYEDNCEEDYLLKFESCKDKLQKLIALSN